MWHKTQTTNQPTNRPTNCAWNFSLPESQSISPLLGLPFQLSLILINPCLAHWYFLTKTCFSIHITSHQRFNYRRLFKPGALCLICCNFALPQNKYFCEIKITFAKNQFQTMLSLDLWKKCPLSNYPVYIYIYIL